MADNDTQQPISPLAADLITAMFKDSANTTRTLVDSLFAQVADLEAEIAAIREGVTGWFDGAYMPNPDSVLRALHPSRELIDRHRRPEVS